MQGELSENILQNLRNMLLSQTVSRTKIDLMTYKSYKNAFQDISFFPQLLGLGDGLGLDGPERCLLRDVRHGAGSPHEPPAGAALNTAPEHHLPAGHGHVGSATGEYRGTLVVEYLLPSFVDLDLGSSPGWWAATVATYCPSRMVEHPKSKSTQPRS